MNELPKLYRRVYLALEWVTDELRGGEHYQDSGIEYIPFRLALDPSGIKFWQCTDPSLLAANYYFDKSDMNYKWGNLDLNHIEFIEKYKHSPKLVNTYPTIKEQRELEELAWEWNFGVIHNASTM